MPAIRRSGKTPLLAGRDFVARKRWVVGFFRLDKEALA